MSNEPLRDTDTDQRIMQAMIARLETISGLIRDLVLRETASCTTEGERVGMIAGALAGAAQEIDGSAFVRPGITGSLFDVLFLHQANAMRANAQRVAKAKLAEQPKPKPEDEERRGATGGEPIAYRKPGPKRIKTDWPGHPNCPECGNDLNQFRHAPRCSGGGIDVWEPIDIDLAPRRTPATLEGILDDLKPPGGEPAEPGPSAAQRPHEFQVPAAGTDCALCGQTREAALHLIHRATEGRL